METPIIGVSMLSNDVKAGFATNSYIRVAIRLSLFQPHVPPSIAWLDSNTFPGRVTLPVNQKAPPMLNR